MQTDRYNYYDILEISPHSPQHEVTSAYERAKSTYSGENPAIYTIFSDDEARNLLKLVEEAYAVIGNKGLRALYDEKIGQSGVKREDLSFESLKTESRAQFPMMKKPITEKVEYAVDADLEKQFSAETNCDGKFLKQVREYKKIPLERMSEITKISAYYISSMEKMDAKNLPAPVFVRGYVAQVCKVLGLDEKKVCESYMKTFKESLGK